MQVKKKKKKEYLQLLALLVLGTAMRAIKEIREVIQSTHFLFSLPLLCFFFDLTETETTTRYEIYRGE